MKIWILNHYATKTSEDGGGGRHYQIAKKLAEQGYDVSVFAAGFLHYEYLETKTYQNGLHQRDVDGINYNWIKTFPYFENSWRRIINMLSFAVRLYVLGRKFPRPDLIIASSVHPLTWLSGYLLAKRFNCRFVSEVRDLWPETFISLGAIGRNSIPAIALRAIEKFVYKKSEKVITLLPGAYKYLSSLGVTGEKIVYIPNGADDNLYLKADGESRKLFNEYVERYPVLLNKDKFKVLYTGALGYANALEIVLQAAKIINDKPSKDDVHFILVGAGPEKQNLIEMAVRMGLKNVTFCDPVQHRLIPYILDCADVCIELMRDLDLYKYGISPNKLFDYLASGKPIIMVGNPYGNLVEKAGSGYVIPPDDFRALAEVVVECSKTDKADLQKLGLNGKKYFEENHTYGVLTKRLIKKVIEI